MTDGQASSHTRRTINWNLANPANWPRGTQILMVFFAVVYVAQQFVYHVIGPTWELLIFHRLHDFPQIFWGYVIAVFSHNVNDPWGHFAFNVAMVACLGIYLEPRLGTSRFLLLFISIGFVSGVLGAIFEPSDSSLGASGGALALFGVALMLATRHWLDWSFLIWIGTALLWVILLLWALGYAYAPAGVGNVTHFAGFTIGIFWALFGLQKESNLSTTR